MNEDNRKRVYDVLKEQTGYLDSYEDFNKAFDASEDNRRRVYDVLKNQTGYLDSYEDFTKGMSAPATSVAQQVIDEYDRSNRSLRTTPPVVLDNPAGSPKIPGYDAVGRLYELMERNKPSLNELVKKNSQDKPESVNDRDTFQTPIYENALRVANRMRKEQAMRSEDYGYRPSIAEPIGRKKNTFEQEEERRIDELYHPKKVENESDVLENYRNRFVLSIRGGKLDSELADKRGEVEAKYLQIFTQSPEYQDLLRRGASAEEINEKFYQQYGDAINVELRPYENAIFQEMASRYRGRIQEEFTQLQKQRSTDQLKALAGEVDELSKQAHKNLQRRAPSSGNAMNALMGSRNYTQSSEEERRQAGMLNAAKRLIEQSQEIVAEAGKKGGTNFVAGLGRGLRDNMDWENFTFGLADMADALYLNNALEKYEAGNTLSEAEQKLLEASAVNMAIQGFYSSDLGRGYNAGRVTAESLPFMLEFIANPISGSSNAIAKSLLKFGLRRFGRAGSFGARVAGSTGAALGMTGTTGVPRVVSGTMERLNQNYDYYLDGNGDLQVQKTGNVGTLEAMGKSIASTALENQSEMVLNAFRVFRPYLRQLEKALPGGVNSFMQMVKESRPGQLYREVKNNPTLRELVQRTQFQGFPQEYLEEVYNNFSNIPLGDMTLEEATDFDNNLDIILGLTPTFLAFGMIGVGSMATERYQNRKHMERIFGKMTDEQRKKFEELQRMSKINGNEDIKNFIKITMADPELTQKQKRDEIDYAFAIAKQNAMDEIQEAETQDRIDTETEDIAGHSDPSTNTYTEAERIYMNDVGEWVKEPGYIVGWQDPEKERFPYWIPEGAEFTPENTRLLRPGEWDATTVKSMPTQEVIDETAQAIREDAAAQAQRESTYSPDIVPYNQLEPGKSSFYDKDGNLYEVGNIDTDTQNYMMLVTSPDGKQIASRLFSEEEYLSIRQAQIDAEESAARQGQQPVSTNQPQSNGQSGSETAPSSLQGERQESQQPLTPQQQEVESLRQAGVDEEVIRNTIADRVKKAKAALDKAERQAKAPVKDAKTVKEEMSARKKALDEARAVYEGWNALLSPEPVPQVQQTQEDTGARRLPQGHSLAPEEADALLADMESRAEVAPELELTIENWDAQFGADALVQTPIGEVKMGENQFAKMMRQGRNSKLGMVKPTLENPDAIIEEKGGNVDENAVERTSSYIFVKAFAKPDGGRYYYFTSVTVSKDGREVVISNQEKSQKRISKLLRQNPVAWINDKFSSHPITQIEGSVPLSETNKPTQTDNRPALLGVNSPELSEDKGTNHSAKKQASAVETIPTDEKGRPLYHRASVDTTLANINSKGLTPDEVDAFVQANKDAAAKLLKKEEDKAPKMVTDLDKYVADKAAWQSRVSEAHAQVDYWNQVAEAIAAQRTQVGDTTAEDILAMGEPMNGYELAAQMLATGKLPLLQSDFKRETGYKGDEARALFGLFASEANGGMTIERAGEQLMLADQEAGTNFFDQSDPNAGRNAILDVLSEVRTRGDLTNYIRRNREAMAERERQAEYDAYADWCDRKMHMTPEEYEAYQEYVAANNPYEGVPVAELDRIFAEAEEEIQTYLNQQDNGQQGTSENGSSPDSGPSERDEPAGAAEGREAGVSVLPEAQPVLPGQVQGRAEGTASQPGTADDGVRAEEGVVSEGTSGGEGIENQINDENNEINVVSSQSNQNDTENEQGEVAGISGESSSLDGENEAATILRRAGDRTAASDGRGSWTKESLLGDVVRRSKESQTWIEDIQSIAGKHLLRGGENDVYLSNDGKSVIKVNDFSYLPDNSTNFDSFMNRVDAHNELFPNDAITILGFTRNSEGKIAVVLSQPYIGNAREATQEEIDNFLEGMDFYTDMSGNWTDGTFDIADTKPNNVLVDADGNLHFIDVLPYDSRKPGKMLVIPPTRNAFVAPEREEGENLLDYAERVVKTKEIDDARKEVASSPTDAQKEAGNYKKGHITLDGYDITIENPKGSTRSGVDANGQSWSVTMNNDYGYIRGTEGVDGDHIDVFLSDDPTTGKVYVIDQVNEDGSFDEHKVMYGFKSALAAKRAYLANYSPGWKGLGTISEVSKEEFKKWVESSHRKTKPFAEYKNVKVEGAESETIKTHQPNALPGRLMKAYESGNTALIASVEQEMREFVNSATDMRSVYSTYLRSKDLERAMEKGSPSDKTQHFIAETCKDVLKKVGLPAKAMQSERARTEFAGSTTDPRVLDIMSADTSFNVLRAIVHNPNISESTLKHFTTAFSNNGLDYEAQQELARRQSENGDELRFREVDVEERKELVAVHNLSADKLKQAFGLGGFPMPSIAITKADVGHTEFGEISLVFDKESINPTDRRNKVYGEDAWTPTFPTVGYKLNDDKTSDIYRRANKTGSLPLFNPVIFHPDNYESYISSVGSEGLVNHFKDDYGAKQLYLSETGSAVEKYEQHEVDKYLPDQIALYEKMLKEIGIERIKNERSDALENEVKRLIEEHYNIDLDGMKPFRAKARISNTIHHAVDYAEHGNRKTETDIEATKKKIDERIDPEKFEAWLEALFTDVVEKKGIRNDKDMFTPSGSSRKWEQLYDDITLDSVVNAMQRQAARGGQGLFNGSIFGAAQEEYKSIDEIRKEARERIRTLNDEEYKAQRDNITDRLSNIKIPGVGDGFSDAMDMAGNIQDAVARSHTAKGIHKYLKGFYPKVTMEAANEIADIVKDIQRMSARYFEAKPYRAVGFDEVRLAVVPSDMDKKLVQELEQRGIPVRTYERGNEAQRRQIVEEATDEMNLRFRFIGEQGAARLDNAEEATTRLDNLAVARQMEEERKNDSEITRNGSVNLSDDALSSANDPVAKLLGKSTRTARQRKEFAERERRNMAKRVQELAEKLHLDNVEIVTEPMTITDRQGKTHHPKGFYNPRTGKITIVIPNHTNEFDVAQTLLHEAVAHYGLRQLFGEHFDAFLDNVFNSADLEVRRKIVELAKKNGWNPRLATEEYLASLAENTNFENLNASWWRKIKELFLRMLHKIGFNDFNGVTLSDNELRYILWRSYENLAEPGRYRSILGEAADVVKQHELKVGNYAPVNGNVSQVADARESAKAERIQKLRDSKPVEITGNEIEAGDDLKQYKKNALEYGKKLRASYQNKDTGITVQLGKTGVKEVLNHDYKNVEQLQSIAAIPQIIENSIYIDSQKNTDPEKNRDVSMYHYYVCGLKIGNTDYTVRAVIAEQPNGNRYYDHKLTQIEKGKLLDSLSGITTPGFNQKTSLISDIKDTKLFSILQTNNEENLLFRESTEENQGQNATDDMNDESPSPISTPTVQAWDKLMNSFGFQFSETSFDHLAAVEEFQKLVEKHSGKEIKSFENVYDQMIALSSKTKNEMEMFDSFILTPMNKAILKLVGEKPVLKRWSWDKGPLRDLAVYVEAKHGVERNRQMAVEAYVKGFNNESLKFFEDAGLDFDREKYKSDLKEAKKKAGDQAYAASYDKNLQRLVDEGYEEKEADEKAKELARKAKERAEDNASEKFRTSAREQLAEQYREKVMADWFEAKKRINGQQDLSWIKKQQMLDEEAGKLGADLSKDYSGLSSLFKDKEKYKDGWNTAALKYVEEYEKSHPQEDIDEFWKSIELATDYALKKQYESGLVSKEYVERQKERFENYVPLRGFADEIAGDVYNYIGNEFYAGGNPVKKAGGRTSEAGNPFGSILNIAYSSMSVGNKNMAKLALYSLVVNHDTGGLAIPGRAWMVKYDELKNNKELSALLVSPEISNGEETPEWVEAVPQFPEKATSEEITRTMNNFEEAMKVYQKKGDVKPIGKRVKIPYRTLYKERDQHDIPLFIAGDKYVITVTGNPRLAQAMNGLLNPDVNNDPVSVIGKKIQRFMAGAFTAQNASFAVANLSRDTIYANNQAFIRENFRYWKEFTKNQRLGFGDYPQMMRRLYKYRHNQLDMNNKTERFFKEFMENGGATGYTFINDQDEYAREIAKQMKKLSGKIPSYITPQGALKLMFDGIEFAGQSAELVNRFAAYKTSREMGRPISRSIRDAKEITVNFNRKGAGMKTAKVNRSTEGKGLIAGFRPIDFVACLSQLGRSHIIFWNANMQGKRRTYLNFKEHPVKTTVTLVANNLVIGAVVLPFLNNVVMPALFDIFGLGSGDDDEDYYDALTDWERTNNLCLRLPHGYWLKIPMAPDMSSWLSMGDAIGGSLTGKRELTYSDFAKSLVDVASPISINWSYGSKHFGLNFVPSVAQPYLQNMMNVNFMGNPIYKTPFNARQGFIPEYKMVYRSTSPTLIELSRISNLVTGGSDIKTSGGADWNPAVLQNMISGYTGGWGNTMLSIADLMLNTLKGEETSVAMSQVPLVSRFVISGNKDMQLRRVNSSFYKVKDFINEFEYDRKSLENAIREAGKDGNMLEVAKYQDELNQLFNSARCQKYVKLKAIEKGVKSYEEWLNETPNDEMMQDMVIGLKKEGIEELNR